MPDELIVESNGPVVRLTLNRPERRNALTPELIARLLDELAGVEADTEVRVVVLTGAGNAFCAGYDIDRIDSPGRSGAGIERDRVEELCSRVRRLRQPALASVSGAAFGAGCDLALSCDVRLASPDARFSMTPARLGLLYSYEGTARLVSVAGAAVAKEMLLSAAPIEAARAERLGLVSAVYPADRLAEETDRVAEAVAANAPLSVQASKVFVNLIADGAPLPPELLATVQDASSRVWASDDSKEGPRAFRERRAPRFTGT